MTVQATVWTKKVATLDNEVVLLFHCCATLPYKGKRTCKMCQHITLYNPGLTSFSLNEDEAKKQCSGIINLLFVVLVNNSVSTDILP